jgi:hypothetical protein
MRRRRVVVILVGGLLLASAAPTRPAPAAAAGSAAILQEPPAPTPGSERMVTVGGLRFRASSYTLRPLRPEEMPWYTTAPLPLLDTTTHDAAGVRLRAVGGRRYNHPVRQAQYAIRLMYSYLLTGRRAYLDRAAANAQRLIDASVVSRGAMYFVYPFDFARHGQRADTMRAPWYSAMAQGLGLTAFALLYRATGNRAWAAAADKTFATFLNPRARGEPWTVFVDGGDYLWFEEYPRDPPDYTLNGHIFAIEGLFDYYRMTGKPEAMAIAAGGLTSVLHYMPDFRRPGGASLYCLTHRVVSTSYHYVDTRLLLELYAATGDARFAAWSDRLDEDLPDPAASGTVIFAAGTFSGYRFDGSGRIVGRRTITLAQPSSAPASHRARIRGRSGTWLRISAGAWSGYWIQQSERSYLRRYSPIVGGRPPDQPAFQARMRPTSSRPTSQ